MKLIGLTGGIGSGKSVVSELLRIYGIPVYDSDERSKDLCHTDESLKTGLVALFGPEVYRDGCLNRPLMAKLIFEQPEKLKATNALIHPVVERDFMQWTSRQHSELVVQETAILFEAGLEGLFDRVVCVTAPRPLRIERVCSRSHMSPESVVARMENQLSEDERIRRSDFVLVNDGVEPLIPQVEKLLKMLRG